MSPILKRWLPRALLIGGALAIAGRLTLYRGPANPPSSREPTYAGSEACLPCHPDEHQLWSGSHHDLSMQVADAAAVLGDFTGETFRYYDRVSTFIERQGQFFVRTEGSDGKPGEYRVAYTLGASPLQQYLLELPGGRYQALSICWDARPASEGGERWFHLYPGENVGPGDELHWTGLAQNWNHMCADCHSTNVKKGYRVDQQRFETTWSGIDVGCEACHGPGSLHIAWAEGRGRGGDGTGITVDLKDRDSPRWVMNMVTGLVRREPAPAARREIETCAPCHSRRAVLNEGYQPGEALMDSYHPALLDPGLYHADGQNDDEVYEYGSFLQSKMYREGVSCKDCHDPHSTRLRRSQNDVCAPCHLQARFDTQAHHFHREGSPGSACADCHMPAKNYMVVDPRHDHSFRVPRPDLTVKIGVPNACNGCHRDRSPRWADEAVTRRYGRGRSETPHFGEVIHAGQAQAPGADRALLRLARDPSQPGIARATALSLLASRPGPDDQPILEQVLDDREPLVRTAALSATQWLDPAERMRLASPRLADPVRAVRIEAARVVSSAPRELMPSGVREAFERAIEEHRAAQEIHADRPESHLQLGVLAFENGDAEKAEQHYRQAIRIDARFVPAYVNLADLYRVRNRDDRGEEVLLRGTSLIPESAELHSALGLLLVRRSRLPEAIAALGRALELRPDDHEAAFAYGIALHAAGNTKEALEVLSRAHDRSPGSPELLLALATISRDRGYLPAAVDYARKLSRLTPGDPVARRLVEELEGKLGPR